MNAHTPPEKGIGHAAATHCLHTLMKVYDLRPDAAVAVADAFLERVAPAMPDVTTFWRTAREECDWWADFASDAAVTAMLAACLRRVAERPPLGTQARKRAMAALWQSLPPQDRAAFLKAVDPRA